MALDPDAKLYSSCLLDLSLSLSLFPEAQGTFTLAYRRRARIGIKIDRYVKVWVRSSAKCVHVAVIVPPVFVGVPVFIISR